MKVYEFTIPQVEYYKTFCNFDEKEAALFELRRKNIQLEKCAEILKYDYCAIKKISSRINRKIINMTDSKKMNDWIENVYWENILKN